MWETFSKRRKAQEKAGQPDVFQYEKLPQHFRVQVAHIWRDSIGHYSQPSYSYMAHGSPSASNEIWIFIHDTLARERGEFHLGDPQHNSERQCGNFLLNTDTEGALDIIEISFFAIQHRVSKLHEYQLAEAGITQRAASAIAELNDRFREHGIGYQYLAEAGKLIRLDSQFTHAQVIKPALSLLNAVGFTGPSEEFIKAFEHYRHGRNKEAVAEALKAFESTMKTICAKRKWAVATPGTAKPLIDAVVKNGLVPTNLESHFTGLRSAMESGLPTISNSTSRHGQGATPTVVPAHFAAFALHLAASNIVFLVEAYKALP